MAAIKPDPIGAKIFKLENGLRVYISVNKAEPRINTAIAVRAGSRNDPADATGLAHYLEHMLFKGTDQFGTLDYEKEKIELEKIYQLYDQYNSTKDEAARADIYRKIDSVSAIAARYAIPNEYDKLVALLGAKGTNAYTSNDQTVYVNDIPANQLERWLKVEAERFRKPVMRIFHTELEAVYEEKNMSLDNDGFQVWETMYAALFPTHPYGTQTTIGTIEHLKNPSLRKIEEYYYKYYVPGNMAICLSGDLDPQKTLELIEKYFGQWRPGKAPEPLSQTELPLTAPVTKTVLGPEAEEVVLAYRLPGMKHNDTKTMVVIDMLLSNSSAGLIDLNLKQKQKVLSAGSTLSQMKEYSVQVFHGKPLEGQKLEDVAALLLQEIDKIKKGDFDEQLLRAVIKNIEIDQLRRYESNNGRTQAFVDAFTNDIPWNEYATMLEFYRGLTKAEIVRVANLYFTPNFVTVYKKIGENPNKIRVPKPPITPIVPNRDAESAFSKSLRAMSVSTIEPEFIDYNTRISRKKANGLPEVLYVQNEENRLFKFTWVFDFGQNADRRLPFFLKYLDVIGTEGYAADALKRRFYELGCTVTHSVEEDRVYLTLEGLEDDLNSALALFVKWIRNPTADADALKKLVDREQKIRMDRKKDQNQILWNALYSYAVYGPLNPFTDIPSDKELRNLSATTVCNELKKLLDYNHKIYYYGSRPLDSIITHTLIPVYKTKLLPPPSTKKYIRLATESPRIFAVDFDMVQADVVWLYRSSNYDPNLTPQVRLFNEYYGGGMSSIVFQQIREAKALAYSTSARLATPLNKDEHYYATAYIGTQGNKLRDAVPAMDELLNKLPESNANFETAKITLRNQIASERINRSGIFDAYERARHLGLDYDIRKKVYEALPTLTFKDIEALHSTHFSNKPFTMLLVGSLDTLDLKDLETKHGKINRLNLNEIFGY